MSAGKPFESVLLGQHRGEKIYCLERLNPAPARTKKLATEKRKVIPATPSQSSCSTEYMPTLIGTSTARLDRSLDEAEEKHIKQLIDNLEQSNGIIHVSSEKTLWLRDCSAKTEEVEEVEDEVVFAKEKDSLNALPTRPEGRRSKRGEAGAHKIKVEEILLEEIKDSIDILPAVRSSRREAGTHEVEEKVSAGMAEQKQAPALIKLPVKGLQISAPPPGPTGRMVGRFRRKSLPSPMIEVPEVPEVLGENAEDAPRMSEVPEFLGENAEDAPRMSDMSEVREVLEGNVEEPRRPVAVKLPRLGVMRPIPLPPGDAAMQAPRSEGDAAMQATRSEGDAAMQAPTPRSSRHNKLVRRTTV